MQSLSAEERLPLEIRTVADMRKVPCYLCDLRCPSAPVGSDRRPLRHGNLEAIVMGVWDDIADRQFAKDDSGRLVFLPRGPRRPAYFVDSTDENKIKSLVKITSLPAPSST